MFIILHTGVQLFIPGIFLIFLFLSLLNEFYFKQ